MVGQGKRGGYERRGSSDRSSMFRTRDELLREAIADGLERTVEKNPLFKGKEKALVGYLDTTKLKKHFWESYAKKSDDGKKRLTDKDMLELENDLANYIGLGHAFNKRGKEFVLSASLKKAAKGDWKDYARKGDLAKAVQIWGSKKFLKKRDYIARATVSFSNLKKLMETGDYAQRMPELSKAVTGVYDTGFFDAAASALFQGKLLDPAKYKTLVNNIYKKAEEGTKQVTKTLEQYVMPKVTGAILGIVGLGVILSANSLTGAVIGTSQTNPIAILWGAATLILGAWLGFRRK